MQWNVLDFLSMANNEGNTSIMDELTSIFPQHSQDVLKYVHNSVVEVYGIMANDAMTLPSCIERILELPQNFVPPKDELLQEASSDDYDEMYKDNSSDISDSQMSSSEESTNNVDHTLYRNKNMPRYRNPVLISSGENSPVIGKIENDYFGNDGIDDVLLLEDISTPADKSKPKVLEDDDDDVLEVSITLNRSKRKNDSQIHDIPTPDLKKRKSSSDKDSPLVQSTTKSFSSQMTAAQLSSSIQSANIKLQLPTFSTPVGKNDLFTASSKSTERQNLNINATPVGKNISYSTSSTITKSSERQNLNSNTTPIGKNISYSTSITSVNSIEKQPTLGDLLSRGKFLINHIEADICKTLVPAVLTPPPPPKPLPELVNIAILKKGMKDFDYYVKKRVVSTYKSITRTFNNPLIT